MTIAVSRKTSIHPAKPPRGLWAAVRRRAAIARQRHALRNLDDHLLSDIGVTRDQAITEAEEQTLGCARKLARIKAPDQHLRHSRPK